MSEQEQEVELLRSVYLAEFIELDSKSSLRYAIIVVPDENAFDGMLPLCEIYARKFWVFYLTVDCPNDYPENALPNFSIGTSSPIALGKKKGKAELPPIFSGREEELRDIEYDDANRLNPDDEVLKNLEQFLSEEPTRLQTEQGCAVVVFDLINALKERLINLLRKKYDVLRREQDAILEEAVQIEMKKFQGTKVTRENFLEWRQMFEAEMTALEAQKIASVAREASSKPPKLTGKQLFETDKSMVVSDKIFITDDDEVIDPSVFDSADLGNMVNENEMK